MYKICFTIENDNTGDRESLIFRGKTEDECKDKYDEFLNENYDRYEHYHFVSERYIQLPNSPLKNSNCIQCENGTCEIHTYKMLHKHIALIRMRNKARTFCLDGALKNLCGNEEDFKSCVDRMNHHSRKMEDSINFLYKNF